MTEDKARVCLLLDFYSGLLTKPVADALDYYYNDDLSYSEIAENLGISRQGVRDSLLRGEAALNRYEDTLHMCERYAVNTEVRDKLINIINEKNISSADKEELNGLLRSFVF